MRVWPLLLALASCARGDAADGTARERALGDVVVEDEQPAVPEPPFAVRAAPHRAITVRGVTLPEPPRWTIDARESSTPSGGRRVRVATAGELRDALRDARGGDVILLAAGREFVGNFVLAPRPGASDAAWITIRGEGAPPPEGTRLTPDAARGYARILTPNTDPAIRTAPGAHHYRLSVLEVSAAPKVAMVYSLVTLGDAGPAQARVAGVPHHLVLDRMWIHGSESLNLRRCVAANSAWTAIVSSWLADCHSNDGDAQAIWGSNGPGPFAIVNNYLEGSGENIMFGGSDSRSAELLPADITILRNHVRKPLAWKGRWVVKNLLELKVGHRVLIAGNVFEGSWVAGQTGFAFVLKSSNQEGTAPWSSTQDVAIRLNRVSHTAAGIQIAGTVAGDVVTSSTARVLVEHNLVDPLGDPALGGVGHLFAVGTTTGPRDVLLRHNTGFGTNAAVIFYEGRTAPFAFLDNVANGGQYRWSFSSSEGKGVGSAALAFHAPGGEAEGNVFVDGDAPPRPPKNSYVALRDVGFAGIGGLAPPAPGAAPPLEAYALRADSRFHARATDGTNPGVDVAALDSAIAGVADGVSRAASRAPRD